MKRVNMTSKILTIVTLLLGLLFSHAVLAVDIQDIIADCNDCHGKNGLSVENDIPIIAGQSYLILEDALIAYAAKERPCIDSKYRHGDINRTAITMCEVASKLTKNEIEAISEHYETLPFVAIKQDFDAALVTRGAAVHKRNCEKCHSEGGSLADDDAGILAGQWTAYLRTAIKEYLEGERAMSDKMADKMKLVKPEDFEALLSFYASNTAQGDSK
ncbi:hypothetical protein MNBD_GAMMA01-2307 [hydrothermal vent metagenome]|uniref:Cytochrome c domain-containing protein n=1 Tax=hydrothermal vent metagenome TaxID=652676 RepID=A0A3B0V759_9ZZZZ